MPLAFAPERIEQWPLARLQPYARNAKLHGPDQVAKIAASMAEFGWTVPCLVGDDGELIAGHGRVLAATQPGLTEAPVIVLGHLTEAQRRAYRIADNKLTKPLDAFGIPMRQHVARGGLCYEPFCGSGSQIMVGEANGRRVYAMEISPAYVDVAIERWQNSTGKDATLDSDGRTFATVKAERLNKVQPADVTVSSTNATAGARASARAKAPVYGKRQAV
ncbi:hypothetical protein AFEL58S_00131 [Afipia felis]